MTVLAGHNGRLYADKRLTTERGPAPSITGTDAPYPDSYADIAVKIVKLPDNIIPNRLLKDKGVYIKAIAVAGHILPFRVFVSFVKAFHENFKEEGLHGMLVAFATALDTAGKGKNFTILGIGNDGKFYRGSYECMEGETLRIFGDYNSKYTIFTEGVADKLLAFPMENAANLPEATSFDFFAVSAFNSKSCSCTYDYYDLAEDKIVTNQCLTEWEVYSAMKHLKLEYAWTREIPKDPNAPKEAETSLPEPVTTTL